MRICFCRDIHRRKATVSGSTEGLAQMSPRVGHCKAKARKTPQAISCKILEYQFLPESSPSCMYNTQYRCDHVPDPHAFSSAFVAGTCWPQSRESHFKYAHDTCTAPKAIPCRLFCLNHYFAATHDDWKSEVLCSTNRQKRKSLTRVPARQKSRFKYELSIEIENCVRDAGLRSLRFHWRWQRACATLKTNSYSACVCLDCQIALSVL